MLGIRNPSFDNRRYSARGDSREDRAVPQLLPGLFSIFRSRPILANVPGAFEHVHYRFQRGHLICESPLGPISQPTMLTACSSISGARLIRRMFEDVSSISKITSLSRQIGYHTRSSTISPMLSDRSFRVSSTRLIVSMSWS